MRTQRRQTAFGLVLALSLVLVVSPPHPFAAPRNLPLAQIKLPPGFHIALYADNVPNARELCSSPSGVVYVGSNNAGKVYALYDRNHDGVAEEVRTVASGLNLPVGLAFHNGDLYYSEVAAVWRIRGIEKGSGGGSSPKKMGDGPSPLPEKVASFPDKQHHGWKFIAFGPDGKLYVPVGVPCNVCNEGDPFGCILRMNADGSDRHVVARGMRNTVGFDWDPATGEMWWTDNGRDMLGDDKPPDELNRIAKGSGVDAHAPHYGFPFWHGHDIPDPDYGANNPGFVAKDKYVKPVQDLGPHVAALGMCFYHGKMFPAAYRGQIFIPEHGSWNRTHKLGYRITLVKTDGKKSLGYTTFASGWLEGETAWGRPDDLLVLPDGSLLVSDDFAGCVYRITYTGK